MSSASSSPTAVEAGWVRVFHDEELFGGMGDQVVVELGVGPSGAVAVGVDGGRRDVSEDDAAVVWLSRGGSLWTRVATDPTFRDAAMSDVVWFAKNEVFVAVGRSVSQGAVWSSDDGVTWKQGAKLESSELSGGIEIQSVVAGGPGLVAVGQEWLGEGSSIPAMWTSDDGDVWDRVDLETANWEQRENSSFGRCQSRRRSVCNRRSVKIRD